MSRIKLVDKDREETKTPQGKGKQSKVKIIILAVLLAITASLVVFGTYEFRQINAANERLHFGENDAAHFGKTPVPMAEFMLFSVDIKNGYEKQYGENIWTQEKKDANGNKDTYENIAKEDILEQIRLVWALNKEGKAKGVKLTNQEEKIMNDAADSYYDSLVKAKATGNGLITKKDVRKFYTENYFAQKAYYKVTGNNSVNASSGSSVAAQNTAPTTTAEAQQVWKKIVNKWYPDFDYRYDINWTLLDQLSFSGNSASGDASTQSSESESDLSAPKLQKIESEEN